MLKGDDQKTKEFRVYGSKRSQKCQFSVELLKGNGTQAAFLKAEGMGQDPSLKLEQIYCNSDINLAHVKR